MSSIHQEVTIKATPRRIYEALTDSKQHAAFTAKTLAGHLAALVETPQRLAAMAAAAHAAGRPDAAARLADLVGEMTELALSPSGVAA